MQVAIVIAIIFAILSTTPVECITDTECAALCPEGTRDLMPDHPDYCDGGPQPVSGR